MRNLNPGIIPVDGQALTTSAQFDDLQNSSLNPIPAFVNSKMALLDRVFPLVYSKGPSKDAMFFIYSAASMPDAANSNQRLSMLRQYPGMKRQVDDLSQAYDPSQRSWFTSAPNSGVGLKVYQETFTKQLVINLATKTTLHPSVTRHPALPCPPVDMGFSASATEFTPYAASAGVCSSYSEFYTDAVRAQPACCRSACQGPDFFYMNIPAAKGTVSTSKGIGATPYRCTSKESQLNSEVTLVHAAVLALSEVASIISKIEIQANRFIVICNRKTAEVLFVFCGTFHACRDLQPRWLFSTALLEYMMNRRLVSRRWTATFRATTTRWNGTNRSRFLRRLEATTILLL
jgi:hypothetical protein